jgi:hypothetical protein
MERLLSRFRLSPVGVPPELPEAPTSPLAPLGGRLAREQFGLFVIAAAGMVLGTPRVLILGHNIVVRLLGEPAAQSDLDAWPQVPGAYLPAVALALLTFFLRSEYRLMTLVVMVIPLAILNGRLDLPAVVPLTVFLLAAFAIIRVPIGRLHAALLVSFCAIVAFVGCLIWVPGTAAVRFTAGLPMLVPMLWYSVYEHGRRPLPFRRFLLYMAGRFFSAPVFTYADVFATTSGSRLTATRWAGVRAIYIALLASVIIAAIEWLTQIFPLDDLTGSALLVMSYLQYVAAYCGIVIRFNLVIGILRLFGVPVRDNFRYWLLARTPNEHWQRWNVLFREWVLTFVFFPIMRSRRWLFAAIMASLGTSGALHMVPALARGQSASQLTAHAVYWLINGLAIYAVIKATQLWPRTIDRLALRERPAWSIVGIILTSAFYAILHGFRVESESWAELTDYGRRLLDFPFINVVQAAT